jgi:hypothetical protein
VRTCSSAAEKYGRGATSTSFDVSKYKSLRTICVPHSRRVCCERVASVTVCVSRENASGRPSHLFRRSTVV